MKKYLKYILCSIILIVSLCIFSSCANDHKEYSINFIIDEDVYKTIKTPGKELIELPSAKEKDKYEFDGWFFDKDKWNKKVLSTSFIADYLTNDIDVYAHYNQLELVNDSECSIIDFGRFNHNGDNLELIVDSGTSKINLEEEFEISNNCELIVCDKELNILDNIIDLSFGENMYKIKIVLNEYIEKEYSLLINRTTKYKCEILDNFGNVIDTKLYDSGNKIEIPSYQIDKKGYSFIGWGLKENDEIIDETYLINSSISLEPKYELLNYDIKYILDGGINNQANPSNYNFLSSINIQEPTKNGYVFKGWKIDGLSSTKYAKEFSIDTGSIGDVTLTAVWEEIGEYEIKYDMQGGVNDILNPVSYSLADGEIKIEKEPTRDGYTFVGWTSDMNLSPKKSISFDSSYKKRFNIKANWTPNYSITYLLNGGINNSANVSMYTILDDDIKIYEPSQIGYTFDGWKSNNSTNISKNITITKGSTGDIVLEATWSKITYSISYVLDGGINNSNNRSTYTVTDEFTLIAPTKQYSTFVGWSTINGEPNKNYTIEEGTTGDITLYANWKTYSLTLDSQISVTGAFCDEFVPSFTLSFNSNGGTSVQSQIISKNNKMIYPSVPTRTGYSFTGWYKDSACTMIFDFTESISADTIVYAGWKSMVNSGYSSRIYSNSVTINSAVNSISVSTSNTTSSTCNYNYFTVFNSGTYYIYYKNSSSSSSYRIYLYIYNMTTNAVVKSNGYITNTSYNYCTFAASAGDIICIRTYRAYSSYSPTFYYYVTGMTYPSAGGGITYSDISHNITAGTTYTFTAEQNDNFIGWYENDKLISRNNTINYVMPEKDVVLSTKLGIKYNISYVLNGGTNNVNNYSYYVNGVDTEILPPTKEGYDFLGWSLSTNETPINPYVINASETGNITLCANWKAKTYKVEYFYNDEVIHTDSVVFGNLYTYYDYNDVYRWNYSNELIIPGTSRNYTIANNIKLIGEKLITNHDYSYTINGNEAEITGYSGIDKELIIPTYVGDNNQYRVTSIAGEAFKGNTNIISVNISSTVKVVNSSAFYNCSSLSSIKLNEGLEEIKETAFYGSFNSKLSSIEIPSSVTKIGSWAFAANSSLKTVKLNEGLISIDDYAFSYCSALTEITIPSSVTSIGNDVFANSAYLQVLKMRDENEKYKTINNVLIDKNTKRIICISLNAEIPDDETAQIIDSQTTVIGRIQVLNITKYIKNVEANAFVSGVNSISVSDENIYYYKEAGCLISVNKVLVLCPVTLSTLNIPSDIEKIGERAFYSCSNLTSVKLNDGLKEIESNAFYGSFNSKLSSIEIPSSVTKIGSWAFAANSSLKTVKLNEGLISIDDYAFSYCSALTEITIPSSVTSINNYAFYQSGLTSVSFGTTYGWKVSQYSYNSNWTSITLNNSSSNATYLTSTYVSYYWKRD